MNCKRCGRELTSPKSIELGYGETCYRIIRLQKAQNSDTDVKTNDKIIELTRKVSNLTLKMSVMERQLNKLKENGVVVYNNEPVERIGRDNRRPEREPQKINMFVVIQELKVVFNGDFKSRLEKVPESFLNHENIYNDLTLTVEV